MTRKQASVQAQFTLSVLDARNKQVGEPVLWVESYAPMVLADAEDEEALRAMVRSAVVNLAKDVVDSIYRGLTEDEWRDIQDKLLTAMESG